MPTTQHTAAMDKVKFDIFDKNNGAFLFSLMCNLEIEWSKKIPTACTDGKTIKFNPDWFMTLPESTRATVMLHELWHVGFLHILRGQGMKPMKFNRAADYAINLMLKDEGCSFDGTKPLLDEKWRGYAAEEIYDLLSDEDGSGGGGCWSGDPADMDMEPNDDPLEVEEVVQIVQAAVIAQQRSGSSSAEIEAISEMIKKRNTPKVNWKAVTIDFCQDKARAGLDYKRRNRRYSHVCLPARGKRGRLTELDFFFDVSGSVSKAMVEQMISEIVYIHGVLKPKKLNLIQFDTRIRKVQTFEQGKPIDDIEIVGRGGTSLGPVADYLEKSRPSGAVIMTDLECSPMRVLKGIPILWICLNNPRATVNQGKLIHINV